MSHSNVPVMATVFQYNTFVMVPLIVQMDTTKTQNYAQQVRKSFHYFLFPNHQPSITRIITIYEQTTADIGIHRYCFGREEDDNKKTEWKIVT